MQVHALWTTVAAVRLTEFHEMVREEFGQVRGDSMLIDHVLQSLDGMTAAEAVEAGWEPREVWRALCVEFDVPPARR
jgi:hypothetical protein